MEHHTDICRFCRSEATPDKPLFYPCVCTGSIKYIHQECLVQWLAYSHKEYCELCKHRFSFTPIYSPDMPKHLPIKDILSGLLTSIGRAVKYWFHYTLVAFAWLVVVPLSAYRIYRCLFTGSVNSLLTLPLDMLSTNNVISDSFHGVFVVTCTLCTFISLVWLREQVLQGGGPGWLDVEHGQEIVAHVEAVIPGPADGQVVAAGVGEDEDEDGAEERDIDENLVENNDNNNVNEDNNWNPIEWDRAAEELTWERLLGLDGSLVFLEHVFWVVSLNTLFIFVFAFCPYHIGHFLLAGLKVEESIISSQFEGPVTTLIGYAVFAMFLVTMHTMASFASFQRAKRALGLCYLVVKVSLLVVVEIGVFPLVCGWWLDICSLSMFDVALKERIQALKMAPFTSMFIHWLVGMIHVFYFASFILLLREVVRPGVLWFLRNLNDPEFQPIQEMIHQPVLRHLRRFLASTIMFGTTVLMMLWVPIKILRFLVPGFLPYNVLFSRDAPVGELSLEMLLLQVVLPALLEQGHMRQWLKTFVRSWAAAFAWLLDLRSYLLGDVPITDDDDVIRFGEGPAIPAPAPAPAGAADPDPDNAAEAGHDNLGIPGMAGGVGAAHQAMLLGGGPVGFQPYIRPKYFQLRLLILLCGMCLTGSLLSLFLLSVPVYIGRTLMSLRMGDMKIHELYTAACGLYICWLGLRISSVLYTWIPQGWPVIAQKLKEWLILMVKTLVVMSIIVGIIPLLVGLLFELVVVVPLRVPVDQSPVFFLWQNWAMGVLLMKIICAITVMGPHWWLKRAIEEAYQNGIRNINMRAILFDLCAPIIGVLGLHLAIPYIFARQVLPCFDMTEDTLALLTYRVYPFLFSILMLTFLCSLQARQFKRLYEHIKNDKYLVGQRLVNYERRMRESLKKKS